MTLLTGLKSSRLYQSAVINIHPNCSGTLHRILNVGIPDPFFLTPTQKKKAVWLRKTSIQICWGTMTVWYARNLMEADEQWPR